mmetsp:Transcript_4140/g.14460  ORF Transcript_4140/g.14460 Transcript_4140/m.14460 type:complete len:207 (+) Transcript_4140:2-622(+)
MYVFTTRTYSNKRLITHAYCPGASKILARGEKAFSMSCPMPLKNSSVDCCLSCSCWRERRRGCGGRAFSSSSTRTSATSTSSSDAKSSSSSEKTGSTMLTGSGAASGRGESPASSRPGAMSTATAVSSRSSFATAGAPALPPAALVTLLSCRAGAAPETGKSIPKRSLMMTKRPPPSPRRLTQLSVGNCSLTYSTSSDGTSSLRRR